MIKQKEVAKDASGHNASVNCESKNHNEWSRIDGQSRVHKVKAQSVYADPYSPAAGHSETFKPITERTGETGDSFRLVPTAVEQPTRQHRKADDRDIYGSYDRSAHGES
jgi:hypothetical protein